MIRLKVAFGLVNHTAVMLELIWHFLPVFASPLGGLSLSQMKKSPASIVCNCVFTTTQLLHFAVVSDSHPKSLFSSEIESQGSKCIGNMRVLVSRSSCWHIALAALFTHDRILSQVAEWMNWSVRCVQERLNLDHKWKVYQSVVL